jgi:hypothetical protein
MEDALGPIDEIVLRSRNGEFQVRIYLEDDGSLNANLLVRSDKDKYETQPGVTPARLALIRRGPRGEIIQFSSG